MDWCEQNDVAYIFGFAPNKVLAVQVFPKLDECCVRRALAQAEKVRDFTWTRYAAKSWARARRVVARIEVTRKGSDVRYVVTNIKGGTAEHLYEKIYCARGQAENLIKQHKAQTASDRTSCRSPLANQFRLILHTAAYWLLLDLRDCAPSWNPARQSEFATLRLRLLKIAGRFTETASRIRVSLASCCPEAELFGLLAFKLQKSGP